MTPQPWFVVAGLLFLVALIGGLLLIMGIVWLLIHAGIAWLTLRASQPPAPSPGHYPPRWAADPRLAWPRYPPPPSWSSAHLDRPPVVWVIDVRRNLSPSLSDPARGSASPDKEHLVMAVDHHTVLADQQATGRGMSL